MVLLLAGGLASPSPLPLPSPSPRRGMLSTNLSVGREMLSTKGCIFLVTPLVVVVVAVVVVVEVVVVVPVLVVV